MARGRRWVPSLPGLPEGDSTVSESWAADEARPRFFRWPAKGPRMAKSVDDRGRGARMARRDEGAYWRYVTEEQRSHPGWIGREGDRLSHSRALSARVTVFHADGEIVGVGVAQEANARPAAFGRG